MIRFRRRSLFLIVAVLFLLSFALMLGQHSSPVSAEVLAQDNGIPTIPPSPTPTSRPPVTPPTPMPPAEIPEPITVILFGTGLAALSAAAARRKKAE